jgi:hypothetical protein
MGAEATSAARRLAASQLEEFTVFETDRRRWIVRTLLSLVVCAAASGCATVGDRSYAEVRPRTEVVRTTTSFTEALRCMDGLFVSHGVHDMPITSVGIPDATGKVRGGIRDMLITSVAKMSERSGAFRYVDWEYDNKEIQILWQRVRDEDQLAFEREYADPLYSIRGAVTQFDQNVVDRRYGGGVAVEYNDYSGDALADWTNSASVMALDLNVSNTRTRAIIPGLSSNNSLAIDRRGGALSGALSSANLGVTFDFQTTDAEGVHAGVRTLVELPADRRHRAGRDAGAVRLVERHVGEDAAAVRRARAGRERLPRRPGRRVRGCRRARGDQPVPGRERPGGIGPGELRALPQPDRQRPPAAARAARVVWPQARDAGRGAGCTRASRSPAMPTCAATTRTLRGA